MENDFHIVGVGASAGGLPALSTLLDHVESQSLAIVVVQHRAPHAGADALVELLGRSRSLDVVAVDETMPLAPNRIYVAPPSTDVGVMNGALHLMATPPPRTQLPIDYFFRSLAADQGTRAVGVVLSGTGTDGTFGLKAIKDAGGLTFAQQPSSAQYGGMPTSALESGWADLALAPDELGKELTRIAQHGYGARIQSSPPPPDALAKLAMLVRHRFGVDLSSYKPITMQRRVERRMALARLDRVEDYTRYVQTNADELRSLYEDLLIGVTSFFRDREPFAALEKFVFPRLFDRRRKGSTFRAWVPACSTGEEAYSLAIALFEYLGDRAADFDLRIFATDLDANAIARARRGAYPPNIEPDVGGERLARFFTRQGNRIEVSRAIRDRLIFSTHDLLRDAPLSHMDLVCCRNLLIYLQPEAQGRVLEAMSYALEPKGFLMLGTSETIGDATRSFSLVDRANKIYANKRVDNGLQGFVSEGRSMVGAFAPKDGSRAALERITNDGGLVLLDKCAPPSVIATETFEVLHFRGQTGRYLQPANGAASLSLLKLARPELHTDLRRLVRDALERDATSSHAVTLDEGGEERAVRIEVVPLEHTYVDARCVLILFHPVGENVEKELVSADARAIELETDLAATKRELQRIIEELESANEELKGGNEELQASNESLHCANEELETSREALHASIEELSATNDELVSRANDHQATRDDLTNALAASGEALVVVGLDGRILRYGGSAAERVFGMSSDDVGAHVSTLDRLFSSTNLGPLANDAAHRLTRNAVSGVSPKGESLRVRCTPYMSSDRTIGGAIMLISKEEMLS